MQTHTAIPARLQLAAAITASTAALVLLVRLGDASWAQVDLRQPGAWLAMTPASDALPAALRLVGMAGLCWVLISLLVASVRVSVRRVGTLPASGAMPTREPRWIWPPARRLAEQAVGAALLVGAATPAVAAAPPPPGLAPPAVTAPGPSRWTEQPVPDLAEPPPRPGTGPRRTAPNTRIAVRAGDNLWTLAAAALGAAHGVDGDRLAPRAITPYWLDVVASNRRRLASGDPDLIHPGEVIHLPPLPARSGGRPTTATAEEPPDE